MIAFGYYGGKYSHLKWLLPLLPESDYYCEPFGGSAAVLLNRKPSKVETYNDLYSDVVNFFRVLREHKADLIEKIVFTPFSREEYENSLRTGCTDDLERARRFFIQARQTRLSLAQTASPGRWAYCITTSAKGMSSVVSRWLNSAEGLYEVAERLLRVQIEHRPALEVVARFDDPETLFYVDPPYTPDCRKTHSDYSHEMNAEDHHRLSEVLKNVKGKVAISGYEGLMDDLYAGWYKFEAPEKTLPSSPTRKKKREILWTNYEPKI